jgi:hypothetical protein
LREAHPELEYTLIVRNEERANRVRQKYPDDANVKIKFGTTAQYTMVLEDEVTKTDIIVRKSFFFFSQIPLQNANTS